MKLKIKVIVALFLTCGTLPERDLICSLEFITQV